MTRFVRLATVVAVLAGFLAASPAMVNVASATAPSAKSAPAISSRTEGLGYHQPDPDAPRIALPLGHSSTAAADVSAWAAGHHLTVVGTRNQITTVSGSRAQVAAAFASATAPQVPAALAGVVTAAGSDVSPLRMRPLGLQNHRVPGLTSTPAATWPGGYGSAKLRAATDVSGTGAGMTVATVQFDGWNSSDLTNYASAAGLTLSPGQMTSISVDGAAVSGSDGEDSLDAETLLAMAPAAKQLMYIAPNNNNGLFDVYADIAAQVASQHIAAVSISWGFCEANFDGPGGAAARATLESSLNAIVAAGATLFASSGDDGPYDCGDQTTLSTDWPSVSPNVVGVGGTHLTGSGPYAETAWEDPNATSCIGGNGPSGGGGGTSTSVARPSWQSGVGIGGSFRLVPDISAEADPCVGPTVYIGSDGGWEYGGGTSLSTPIVAGGLISELSNTSATTGIGDIHSKLYGAPGNFRDVTSGSYSPYSAGVGYDELTGLGTPQWDTFFVLGAPTNVVADPGNAALSVSWQPPLSTGTSPITHYTATATPGGATCQWTAGPLGCILTGLTNGTSYTVKVTATNGQGTGPASAASAPATPGVGDAFHALTPARVVDSRSGLGGFTTPWGSGVTRNVTVGGAGGVPSNAAAVVLNVTETGATGSSYLSIWPAGAARPTVSSLNFTPGETIPNQVTVKLGAGGQVSIFNAGGNADVIVDVTGYYDTNTGDGFTSVTPARILDSRPGPGNVGGFTTPWASGVSRDLQVGGVGGVPSDADAVVLNVTVTGTTAGSFLSIWPQGAVRPTVSSLNWVAGETIPNAVTVKLAANGKISLYNLAGNADVIVDVAGYFKAGTGKVFYPLTPGRILDSRPISDNVGGYTTPWGAGTSRNLTVGGVPGVLTGADSVVVNVTVTNTSSSSYLTLWPQGASRPTVSSLNWTTGETIPNAATVKLSAGGAISIYNNGGSVDAICDVAGYYA
jgi:hypothetical protein